ncbi:MAG: ABC transporter permease subunit [Hadesarchaea archaeon]|nr:ABC transporter permease subunit [Hadesarchaea archaeon]
MERKTKFLLFLFLLPAVVALGLYAYYFSAWNFSISTTDARSLIFPAKFIGLANYERFLVDPVFGTVVKNTITFTLLFMGGTLSLGLFLAILIDQGIKGEKLYKVIILIPMAMPMVISGVLWSWMFSPRMGVINSLLITLRLDFLTQPWTTSTSQALFCVIIAYIWVFTGFVALLYLANIRSLPNEHSESARVDGASKFQLYRRVIIPQLKPATVMAVAILFLNSLAAFDLVWTLTMGGPAGSSDLLGTLMYKQTFQWNFFGYGAAIAQIMFLISVVVMVPYLWRSVRR